MRACQKDHMDVRSFGMHGIKLEQTTRGRQVATDGMPTAFDTDVIGIQFHDGTDKIIAITEKELMIRGGHQLMNGPMGGGPETPVGYIISDT